MEDLMRAVIRTFHDIHLRVELVPRSSSPTTMTVGTGTGPARGRDDSAQTVDSQYATVYRVNHCKLIPTSQSPCITEFPPQHAEIVPGRDNFQVGGTGSGETGPPPNKSSCYRGGLTWTSRDAVYSPRVSHTTDTFASSLRKYPPSLDHLPSFEHFPDVFQRPKPRTRRSRSRPSPSIRHYSYQNPDTPRNYEEDSADTPEYPTRDRPDESSRGNTYTELDDINYILNESGRHRRNLKRISSYTLTQTTAACTECDAMSHGWYTALQGSTEVGHGPAPAAGVRRRPVSTPVQAVAAKMSQGIETVPLPIPTRRTIAVPPSPMTSLPTLSIHVSPITRSVQTFQLSGISVETTTSSIEIARHDFTSMIAKKSKSFSDFEHGFNILEWIDDNSDPKVKEFQLMVLENLTCRLKNTRVPKTERIKVKMADCVKSRLKIKSNEVRTHEVDEKQRPLEIHRAEINSRLTTDQSYFEDVIKEWLSNICIKNHDISSGSVKKDEIILNYNSIVNRLKHLVVGQSKYCREKLLRAEIMDILEEVPIEVNSRDKTNYLELAANDLIYRLENVSGDEAEIKSCKFDKSEKLNICLPKSNLQPTEEQKMECVLKKIVDALKSQSMVTSEFIKEVMIDFKDIMMGSVPSNRGIDEITNLLLNTVKLPENDVVQCAVKLNDDWRDMFNKKYKNPAAVLQFSVFMLQQLTENNIIRPSETEISQHSIGSKVDTDIEANLKHYKIQLGEQIERWLSGIATLQTHEKDSNQAAVVELVNDIVDRLKYLEFNKYRGSNMDELEHLKYMIFKWTKRSIGEENLDTIKHAAKLMEMIRSIPVPIFSNSQDQLRKRNSVLSGNYHPASSTAMSINNNKVPSSKINSSAFKRKISQNRSVCTNLVVHKVSTRKTNGPKQVVKRRDQTPPSPNQCKTRDNQDGTSNNKKDSSKHVSKNTKRFSEGLKRQICNDNVCDACPESKSKNADNVNHNNDVQSGNDVEHFNQNGPWMGPSGLVTPTPASTVKGSSATSKLMANWRPPPIYTPPPPGKPRLEEVHDEFQEYLQNWSKQIPIPATNPEEKKTAEQARLGILKGIWKMITKLKTQPAVYQNKFYYEDILGKEIDELLDCLPQTQELKEKRYMLKAQLLEKTTAMNELVQELEIPDNYKEILARALLEKQNERVRKVVKLNDENPTNMFEQMFKYCVLDDFLLRSNYKEDDKIKDKAYKIKLMSKIQEYINELKTTYGKELEDLFSVVKESDFLSILYDVPLPSDDTVKENADEIFLGLEIEQWMMDLPIVNNNDSAEQCHRRRLRDALTKKLLEIEKIGNVPSNETQVRHEISIFLDKIPLEQNQDLNINDMVEDLAKRLKNGHVASDRRKSVAFQNRQQSQQQMNETGGLLHQSQFTNKRNLEDEDARYTSFFQNGPLCSTKIEQRGDEWAMEEDQDAQYRGFFKDRPACSSMIDQQGAYGIEEVPALPDFRQSNEQEPIFAYVPGHFYESARGGSFHYPQHGSVPYIHDGSQYPEPSMMSRYDPSAPRFYNSQGNSIPDYPIPRHVNSQYRSMPGVDARQSIPPMMQPATASFIQPQGIDFEGQNEASGGFVSMMEHGPQWSMRNKSEQRFSNVRRQSFDSHRSGMDASMPHDIAPAGFFTSSRNERSLIEPYPHAQFYPDASVFASGPSNQFRWNGAEVDPNMQPNMMQPAFNHQLCDFEDQADVAGGFVSMREHGQQSPMMSASEQFRASRTSNHGCNSCNRRSRVEINPNLIQEPLEESVHEAQRTSGIRLNALSSHRNSDMLQPDSGTEGGFVSMRSHQSPGVAQAPPASLETSARNHSVRQPNRFSELDPIVETGPEPLPEVPRSEAEINQSRNANRSAHNTQASHRSMRNASTRESAPATHEAASRSPALAQRDRRGLRASNVPTEISNHPVGFSTPNQRPDNDAPPNIRRQRQMEQERASVRRLFSDNEDGEDRCHCVERFRRWHRRTAPNCDTCDDCVHGGNRSFFSYPYQFPYPYPPPYPSYCKR